MAITLTPHTMMAQLKAMQSPLYAKASRDETWAIMERALRYQANGELRLGSEQATALIREHQAWRKAQERPISRRESHRRVCNVLATLNTLPGCCNVLPIQPQPVHRATAMPTRGDLLQDINEAEQVLRQLRPWCVKHQHRHPDAWLVGLALSLTASAGMGERVIVSTLAMLRPSMVGDDQWLSIPSQPIEAEQIGRYPLRLTQRASEALNELRRGAPTDLNDGLLLFTEHDQTKTLKQREKKIRQRLDKVTQVFLAACRDEADEDTPRRLKHWHSLARATRYLPVFNGIAPLWSSLLLRYPLPISTRHALLEIPGVVQKTWRPSPSAQTNHQPSTSEPELLTTPAGVWAPDWQQLPPDWPRRLKNITHQFINTIRRDVATPYSKAASQRAVEDIKQHYHDELTQLTGSTTSYVHLLLDWAYDLLCRQPKGNLNTLQTYLSKLTQMRLLEHPAVLELQDWDDDTVEDLQAILTDEAGIRDSTLSQTLGLMRRFLAFCPELGLLEGIRLPHVDVEVPLSTLRTDIISPSEAASLWKRLTYAGVDGSTRQMYALVIALGCYGGLRISEIASLTLKDVQLEPLMSFATPFNGDRSVTHDESEGEGGEEKAAPLACWILVLDGKSEAARRRIPLHVLSPRRVIPMLQRWVEERKRQCPGRPLDQIALFGPRGNPDAYQKEVLSRETITLLREEMGEHVDFHSLRHAAASWLILRLHAAQSADFLQSLCYQYDEIFTPPRVQEALTHFCAEEGQDTLRRGTLFEVVAKWIGHRHAGTTLQYYVHTLSVIHSDILKEATPANGKAAKRRR
ncbi:tyrosine-type recombinase/integrase [Halomonas sp. I5-271120]|uniref:tyrosine-type recombinase/integrase n=1 Tax=Halomonas sp. I5-271120 TaxID=3061632 RepID=UPI002714E6FA|nr:tyrosine-type recombinase/integrase [Halomonas sp. I5-271120]